MNYLLECAIGPVQDFIATARRSRDLWYGSWMLSELSKAAAQAIADDGGQLIFPAITQAADLAADSPFNAPNKVMAVTNNSPNAMADKAERAVRRRLHELRDEAFDPLRNEPLFDRALADKQVDDLVEFYWVSVPLDNDQGYAGARQMAETLLSARKATRDFGPANGDRRPKSSLDGARESAIQEDAYPAPNANNDEKQKKSKWLYVNFRARPAERLSGVDVLKRLGASNAASFPSTSDMAARPFLRHVDSIKEGASERLLDEIRSLFADNDIPDNETDGDLLFPSRLAELISDDGKRKEVADQLEKRLDEYAGRVRPRPYYALLVADGDNMGKAIDHLTTLPHAQQRHKELSLALSQFAAQVKDVVEKSYDGALVYSGGDDIMAYLPLDTVLDCAHELAEKFAKAMERFKTIDGAAPTLSTGIVVAHHLEPLSDTLDLARTAERAAKTVTGKHGLAITVSKRSGTDRTITGNREQLGERLTKMIDWRRSGAISAGAAYELQGLDRVLGKSGLRQEALIAEALRIIERKREAGGGKQIDTEVRDAFEKWIETEKIKLQELTLELIVATVFADAIDLAAGKLKERTQ